MIAAHVRRIHVMTTCRPEPLELPRGVALLRDDEMPSGSEEERLRLTAACITTGFTVTPHTAGSYCAYIEANVHASMLGKVFRALAEGLMPEIAAPLVGIKDEEPVLGPYTDRVEAIAVFLPYTEALQHDGFLEFGIMFQYQGRTEEIFVRSTKYLKIWTNEPAIALSILRSHGVPEVPDLQFIDNFPRCSSTLPFDGQNTGWSAVLGRLKLDFEDLPPR